MFTKNQIVRFTLFLAVVNLFIAACLGFLIRLFPFYAFDGINVRHIVHSHSHVAFLGWVFIALVAFIYHYWFSGCKRVIRRFLIFLGITQLSVFGMLSTFPFTGYALWSIVFSTIHMLASFYFIYFFKKKSLPRNTIAKPFIYWALVFMALSGIGPLALGPISVMGEKFGMWYNLSIYFYLHFQYNGWFTMAIVGLLLNQVEPDISGRYKRKIRRALAFLTVGILSTYLLSTLGYRPPLLVYIGGGIGAAFQFAAFFDLLPLFKSILKNQANSFLKLILAIVFFMLFSKLLAQVLSSFPYFTELTYFNRDLVVAYLHWVLLGFVTLYLFWSIIKVAMLDKKLLRISTWAFIIGLLLMELLLVLKYFNWMTTGVYEWLLLSAGILLLSVLTFLWGFFSSFSERRGN